MKLLIALAIWAGGVLAGDMQVDFPGKLLLPRADLLMSNLMTFTSSVGDIEAPAITYSGDNSREYSVSGNTFDSFKNAWTRSCDNQKNECANFANSSAGKAKVQVSECDEQRTNCVKALDSATATAFAALATSDAEFDYYCEV